jgi:hypothetical protein
MLEVLFERAEVLIDAAALLTTILQLRDLSIGRESLPSSHELAGAD